MNENDTQVENTRQWRFLVVMLAAIGLALATKALLPEPSGTEYTPQWVSVVGDAISTMVLVIGYGLGIELVLKRGGYSV